MSSSEKSIHEFDFKLICEYYSHFERQGPGSPEMTLRALSFIDNLKADSKILDIGCGTGGQTMVLAQNTICSITGLDLFPEFIDIFNKNAKKLNVHNRVKGITGSMDNIPFDSEEFDLIWSEGSIYNIGFENGINQWKRFLKPGAYLAVSEASWFTLNRPPEIEQFWNDAYPEIDTIPNKLNIMLKAGYIPIATFILPESCWTDNFFIPQVSFQDIFLKKYPGEKIVEEFIANQKHEAELYNKYKEYYGYVFYIGKKP